MQVLLPEKATPTTQDLEYPTTSQPTLCSVFMILKRDLMRFSNLQGR